MSPLRLAEPQFAIPCALLTVYAIWGTTFAAIAFALRDLPPFFIGGARFALAALIMALVAIGIGHPRPTGRQALGAFGLGFFFVVAGNGALIWAEQWVASGMAALLGAVIPLFVLLFGVLLPGGERPTGRGILGVVLGFFGVLWLLGPALQAGQGQVLLGQIALLGANVLVAIGMVVAKRVETPLSWAWNSAWSMAAGGVVLSLCSVGSGEVARLDWEAVGSSAWVGLAYLVVMGSCLGFSAFTYLTQAARPVLVSTISYVIPVLATGFGVYLLREPVTPSMAAAAALIVGSVALVATGSRKVLDAH